jgi:uncharacterized protein YkwD
LETAHTFGGRGTKTLLKLIAVACVGALASCATQTKTTRIQVSTSSKPDSSLSGRIFQEVNSYRNNHGAATLQRHAGLDRLAQEHCEYLRTHRGQFGIYGKNVSHVGFEGRTLIARERYKVHGLSENVAAAKAPGSNSAKLLVKLWSDSKMHEYNMRSEWTHTGVGVVVDSDGMVFSTQLFATVSDLQMTTRNRFNSF